ncbi:MAG TPA: hypothetical protein VMH92_02320 [Acidocella sp.]|nr:hypothetical protein [Acidocella sp.]
MKFASAVALVASLAPFAAQARSGSLGTTSQAQPAAQAAQHDASVAGRGAEHAQLASNDVPTSTRWVGGAATDSDAG